MTRGRLLRFAGLGGALLVVVAVGAAAFVALQTPFQPPSSGGQTSAPCAPKPCASVRGYLLLVADLKVANGLVTMQLTFRNSSPATHADPSDVQLVDSRKNDVSAVHDAAGCAAWPRTDFNNGATFGPVPECFRPATADPPLSLHWTPDMGLFCCDTVINLTPSTT